MLMDNAIVVLENVARHRDAIRRSTRLRATGHWPTRRGSAPRKSAARWLASTLTTIAVFLPLAFVVGIAGQLFRDQALTVTFALLASLVLAFTLIPMLAGIGTADAGVAVAAEAGRRRRGWRRLVAGARARVRCAAACCSSASPPDARSPCCWARWSGSSTAVYERTFAAYDALLRGALRFRAR